MQAILTDIEHNIRELKNRIDTVSTSANPQLIQNMELRFNEMKYHLEFFLSELERSKIETKIISNETLTPNSELRQLISLNDSFRFSRELFQGDTDKMKQVFLKINKISALKEALDYLSTEILSEDDNEAFEDLKMILESFYNRKELYFK